MERKRRLDGTSVEFECAGLLVQPPNRAVLQYVIGDPRALEGTSLVLPAGTVTIAHYWADRLYNVYHWLGGGRTLGYYCSISEDTSITDEVVSYTDLAVDVLIDPRGEPTVLDEEELPPDLPPPQRGVIARALDELTSQSRRIAAEIERESRKYPS